jgi:adenosine deaminase
LFRLGVPVTINSDDPTIQDTDLSDDYAKAERYFGFTLDDFVNLNMTAIETCFLSDPEKETLKNEYLKAVGDFKRTHKVPSKLTAY